MNANSRCCYRSIYYRDVRNTKRRPQSSFRSADDPAIFVSRAQLLIPPHELGPNWFLRRSVYNRRGAVRWPTDTVVPTSRRRFFGFRVFRRKFSTTATKRNDRPREFKYRTVSGRGTISIKGRASALRKWRKTSSNRFHRF